MAMTGSITGLEKVSVCKPVAGPPMKTMRSLVGGGVSTIPGTVNVSGVLTQKLKPPLTSELAMLPERDTVKSPSSPAAMVALAEVQSAQVTEDFSHAGGSSCSAGGAASAADSANAVSPVK